MHTWAFAVPLCSTTDHRVEYRERRSKLFNDESKKWKTSGAVFHHSTRYPCDPLPPPPALPRGIARGVLDDDLMDRGEGGGEAKDERLSRLRNDADC